MARVFYKPTVTPLRNPSHNSGGCTLGTTDTYWIPQEASTTSQGHIYVALFVPTITDGQILSRLQNGSSGYFQGSITVRANTPLGAPTAAGFLTNGYTARLGYISNQNIYIYKGGTSLGSKAADSWDQYVRFQFVGTALKLKGWNSGGTEGETWGIEVTDATYSSGQIAIGSAKTHGDYSAGMVYALGVDYGGTNPPTAGGLKTITGQVRFGGTAKNGVTVIAHRQGADLAYPLIPGIDIQSAVTDASGNFTLTLDTDDTGDYTIEAHYTSGGVKYAGAVVANAGDSGVVIEMRPAYVTRARIKSTWYSEVWDKVTGAWVKRT